MKKQINWTWILLMIYFIGSMVNTYFALFGFICMMMPLLIALLGHGKKHCSHFCPRGSFLGKIIDNISLRNSIPNILKKKYTRHFILVFMFTNFILSMLLFGHNAQSIAAILFRFIFVSFLISLLIGFIYRGRTWCGICPMGHASWLIHHKLILRLTSKK